MPLLPPPCPTGLAAGIVLDTNVVLDWFVFGNPGMQAPADAIGKGQLHWLACAEMRAELAHVLVHGHLGGRSALVEHVLTSYDSLSTSRMLPTLLSLQRPRCSDGSDQMFVDLALGHGARWLLTRDRALLKLARKTGPLGLRIVPPEAWAPA